MTTLTFQFSNNSGGLFELGQTGCEECPKYAVGLFAPVDDEGLFAYCYEHMLAISPLAANVLLGCDAVEMGGEYTDFQLMLIDELGMCPSCGGGLNTGAGFGSRDLECADVCMGEVWECEECPKYSDRKGHEGCQLEGCGGVNEDAHCGWSGSYPFELYRAKLMPKYLAGRGGEGQQLVIPVMEPKQ